MTLSQQQRHFTAMIGQLIAWAVSQGYELAILEAARTKEQQALYVQHGKSQTMASKHLQRLAVDFALFIGGKYQQSTEAYRPLGEQWKALDANNVWGGDWKGFPDGGHFQYGK